MNPIATSVSVTVALACLLGCATRSPSPPTTFGPVVEYGGQYYWGHARPDPERAPRARLEVVERVDREPNCFTQGLTVMGNGYFETCAGFKTSVVRRVENGAVVAEREIKEDIVLEGITYVPPQEKGKKYPRGRLIVLTWETNYYYVLDPVSLDELERVYVPFPCWGVAWTGEHLVISNGSAALNFIELDERRVVRTLFVVDEVNTVPKLNALEYANGRLYANVAPRHAIAEVDISSGSVLRWIDLTPQMREVRSRIKELGARVSKEELWANGIAYDPAAKTFWVTGKQWPYVYRGTWRDENP